MKQLERKSWCYDWLWKLMDKNTMVYRRHPQTLLSLNGKTYNWWMFFMIHITWFMWYFTNIPLYPYSFVRSYQLFYFQHHSCSLRLSGLRNTRPIPACMHTYFFLSGIPNGIGKNCSAFSTPKSQNKNTQFLPVSIWCADRENHFVPQRHCVLLW